MIDGLKAEHRTAIIDALATDDRVERAVLFGSRATETYTSASDVDIALFGNCLTLIDQARLNGVIEALTIPQRVDLVLHATIDNHVLRKHIERHGVEWYRRQGTQGTELQGLLPKHRSVLEAILREHLPGTEVWVYGNRVSPPESDGFELNLVLRTRDLQKISDSRLDDLKKAVCGASFPFVVKPRDWAQLSKQFQQEIERKHVVLVKKTEPAPRFEWKTTALGYCIQMNDSLYSPKEGWPVINYLDTGNITENRIDKIHRLISGQDKIPSRARRKVRPGDILYSTVRPSQKHFGLMKDIPGYFLASTGFSVFRGKTGIANTDFIYWFLAQNHIIEQLHAIAEHTTSAYPSIRPYDIEALTLALPPYPEQRAIAQVLGTLDDKIELNQRVNETLEAMIGTIFKGWFIDFAPVSAMAEGQDTGLPDHIANLFPKKLVESRNGEIPEGWKASTIGMEVKVMGGATPSTKEPTFWNEGKHAWATPKDLSKLASPVLLDTNKKITDAGVAAISSGLLPVGTVLLSSRAPIGYLAISEIPTAINQGFIAMICEKRLPSLYVLFWCHENLAYIRNISGGSTFSEISKKLFRSISITVPSLKVLAAYESIVQPIYDRIVANMKEIVLLANTRDTLLPKLVSGEVCVRDVERMVETDMTQRLNCDSVRQSMYPSPFNRSTNF